VQKIREITFHKKNPEKSTLFASKAYITICFGIFLNRVAPKGPEK
jgi:hypothetical protein